MASDASTDRMARAVLLAGVQQRLVTTQALSAALSTRGPCFRHALIVEALGDADGGVHSVPEHDFSRLVRRRNLPQPARQQLLRRSDGRYYLDAEWEAYRVAAEIQGSHHRIGLQWDDDLERHNAVSAGGRCLLHFSSYSVRHRPDRVADVLHEALVTRGWRP